MEEKIDIVMPVLLIDNFALSLTEAAVESIRNSSDCRIIIIDDGSPHGGLKQLADVYIKNDSNQGYAKSVNKGLKKAKSRFVAVANNDIRVDDNWYKVSRRLLKSGICSVHFRMIPYDQPFNPGGQSWVGGKERWCSSSFFVVRQGQLYDENLYNTYDDYDYWQRWREKGYKQVYTNRSEYQHLDTYTIGKLTNRIIKTEENYEYYKKKHGEYPDVQFARLFPEQMKEPWRPFP